MYSANENRYERMEYNRCGASGLFLPKVSLGLWHNFGSVDNFENMRQMCKTAFDNGITHFDLANNYGPVYGSAEENFGRILKKDLGSYRDELVISTKAGFDMWPGPYGNFGSRKYLIASLDQSLKRMGLEYVDIFYHHRPDPDTPLFETMQALDSIVRSGKALYVGISNYNKEQTKEAMAILKELKTPFIINPQDSRVRRDGRFLKESDITEEKVAKLKALNEIASKRGQTLAQMALSWILKDDEVTSVLIGASRPSQIEENIKLLGHTSFTEEELKLIDDITYNRI